MPWALLLPFLTNLPGTIGQYFQKKQDIQLANIETERQLAIANAKAAADAAVSADNRAIEGLKVSGTWFKYCVFWLISSPFIACLINQQWYANMVFSNLAALPNWYMILYSSIVGVVWGIPVPGSIMGNILDGLKSSTQARRDYKLAVLDKKAYWNAYRRVNKGPISQDTVNKEEAVLNEMDRENV